MSSELSNEGSDWAHPPRLEFKLTTHQQAPKWFCGRGRCARQAINFSLVFWLMPPRQRHRQPPPIWLSRFSARRCWATLRYDADAYERRQLEAFRRHLRLHDIPYFGPSHRIFVRGRYSGQYFPASLRSLLMLEYVPRRVHVPTDWLPHKCQFC